MKSRYWVAQHVSDLFRNEPRNIGVLVQSGGRFAARFFGETGGNQLDGRKLRGLPYADVYRQWVEYWRNQILDGDEAILEQATGAHYRLVPAGEITEVDSDEPSDIVNYLYAMLVSEGRLQEALRVEGISEDGASVTLEQDLANALRSRSLLADDDEIGIAHPVRRRAVVRGRRLETHKPAFVQQNGRLYVMEVVDFTLAHKKLARDHAGWAAYMFHDIRAASRNANAIAIVRCTEEEQEQEEVQNGMALLRNEADIVNWMDESEQRGFIEDRRAAAVAHGQ